MMRSNKGILYLTILLSVLAVASLSCGVSSLSGLFATATPTATQTFTPTLTSTPSPTLTSTPTFTPTSTPLPTGTDTQTLSDGSTLFIDYDNKYQITLPEDWVIIPVVKEDLDAMLEDLARTDPDMARAAEAFKNLDADVLRMAALNRQTKYLTGGYASNITVTAIQDPVLSVMPLSFITGALEQSFTQQGIKVLTTGVNPIENASGMEVEYMDLEQALSGFRVLQRVLAFQSNEKLILITISTTSQHKDEIFQVAEQIGGSLELIK
jgi:hypothetical protein